MPNATTTHEQPAMPAVPGQQMPGQQIPQQPLVGGCADRHVRVERGGKRGKTRRVRKKPAREGSAEKKKSKVKRVRAPPQAGME